MVEDYGFVFVFYPVLMPVAPAVLEVFVLEFTRFTRKEHRDRPAF
jgi:hypothetical protein